MLVVLCWLVKSDNVNRKTTSENSQVGGGGEEEQSGSGVIMGKESNS